ncbi:unnamed protein product [Phytophthora lilii]|uniref:Unnamed protein product n=1 Tax=Phytophthora lilii TaxID=2077276 RepID=A0A9W6U153_9STRA|nr:unnamed protein product [Phytophthora lilii]
MYGEAAVKSNPHILDESSLQIPFVGRYKAVTKTARCFNDIIDMAKGNNGLQSDDVIPFFCGMAGLGKTRMLEEGEMILKDKLKFWIL